MMPRLTLPCTLVLMLTGCARVESMVSANANLTGGDPDRGRTLVSNYGCVACHQIPGVRNAVGMVGPPLTAMARRSYLAGRLPNTPENMTLWIYDPKSVDPQTVMPVTGVSREDARDIVAYLYTLR